MQQQDHQPHAERETWNIGARLSLDEDSSLVKIELSVDLAPLLEELQLVGRDQAESMVDGSFEEGFSDGYDVGRGDEGNKVVEAVVHALGDWHDEAHEGASDSCYSERCRTIHLVLTRDCCYETPGLRRHS